MWRMCPPVRTNIWEVKVSQLKSSQTNEFSGHFSPWYFVSPSSTMYSRGSVGREACFVAVGHVERCRKVEQVSKKWGWVNCKKFQDKWTCRPFFTSIFCLLLVDDVCKGIRRLDVVGGWR
jgi:hypothetical protein